MKIVIGSESFPPNISGVAVFAERMAEYLAKNGHEVYVFAPSRTFSTHWEEQKGYKVLRLRSIPNPFREGFRVAFLPAAEIKYQLDQIKPDIIHIQDPTSICGALLANSHKRSIPILYTNHFSLYFIMAYVRYLKPLHPIIWKTLSWYFARMYNKCTLLTTPSPTARQSLLKMGTKTEIKVISNGVDLERFKPVGDPSEARKHFKLADKPIALYLGRIDKDKSIDVFVKAMPHILKEVDANFVLVGGGDEIPKIKKLTEKLGIADHVKFLGRIEHESVDLPMAYQTATLFCMPSCIETQSIVTLESLSSGLPLVAANATSMPEFTDNGKNGYLFKPGNSKEMANEIIKIMKDSSIRKEMSKNARAYASEHSIEKTFKEFEELYEEVCRIPKKS